MKARSFLCFLESLIDVLSRCTQRRCKCIHAPSFLSQLYDFMHSLSRKYSSKVQQTFYRTKWLLFFFWRKAHKRFSKKSSQMVRNDLGRDRLSWHINARICAYSYCAIFIHFIYWSLLSTSAFYLSEPLTCSNVLKK